MHSASAIHEDMEPTDCRRMRRRLTVHSVWKTSIRFTLVTAVLFGLALSAADHRASPHVLFPHQAAGSLILEGRPGHRLRAARAELHLRPVLPSAPLGCGQWLRRNFFRRLQSGAVQRQARVSASRATSTSWPRRIPASPCPSTWSRPPAPVSIPTSRPTTPTSRRPRRQGPRHRLRTTFASSSQQHTDAPPARLSRRAARQRARVESRPRPDIEIVFLAAAPQSQLGGKG